MNNQVTIINQSDIKEIKDACGDLKELYNSKNISLSYTTIKSKTRRHKHRKLEEIYYLIAGKATYAYRRA